MNIVFTYSIRDIIFLIFLGVCLLGIVVCLIAFVFEIGINVLKRRWNKWKKDSR